MTTSVDLLNVPLQEWANDHDPRDTNLSFKDGYWHQIMFVRDKIVGLFTTEYEDYKRFLENNVRVISTHLSKSVILPVYRITLNDGTEFTLRYNFYNWKVSVSSPRPVDIDFGDLFNPYNERDILAVYCEGFPEDTVFGCYASNKQQFTVEIATNNILWTFFWLYTRLALGIEYKFTPSES